MSKKKITGKETEGNSLKDLISQNNVQKLEILKLDLLVWVILFLKILILGNQRTLQLSKVIEALEELDLFGILTTVYVQVTEHNLRNLFLENYCECRKTGKGEATCSDEYCEKEKICQLTRRVIDASLELFLIVKWLQEYHNFSKEFESSLETLRSLFPK